MPTCVQIHPKLTLDGILPFVNLFEILGEFVKVLVDVVFHLVVIVIVLSKNGIVTLCMFNMY